MMTGALNFLYLLPAPFEKGYHMRESAIHQKSCIKDLGSRCPFVAQLITSVVALPFLFLASLIFPAIALCTRGKTQAWNIMKEMGKLQFLHLLVIPTALISALAPPCKNPIWPVGLAEKCMTYHSRLPLNCE